jgi:hypothetical protein
MKPLKKIFATLFMLWQSTILLSQTWTPAGTYLYVNPTTAAVNIGGSGAPFGKLDVSGNINAAGSTDGYCIGNSRVLWQNSSATSLFVGKGAGAGASATANNTFVGINAGSFAGISCTGSTAIGFNSGSALTTGDYDLFAAYESGKYVTTGATNVLLGKWAGVDNVNMTGTTTGSGNIFIGFQSGKSNTTTNYNTAIGYDSDISNGLTNAHAIGYSAVATASNTMILGNNDVSVGVGYSGSSLVANSKFNVYTNTGSSFGSGPVYGGYFLNANNFTSSPGSNPYAHGIYAEANGNETNNTTVYHYGGSFRANGAYRNVAVSGVAVSKPPQFLQTSLAYGGYFNSSISSPGGGNAYGVYATVGNLASLNIAVYGTVTSYTANNYAGYFQGDVYTNGGTNSLSGYLVASDRQFKTDIQELNHSLDILSRLKPSSYFYDTKNNKGLYFTDKKQFGFIAQELEQVLPELVYDVIRPEILDDEGNVKYEKLPHKAVNYDGLIAVLVSGMQEQQKQIDELKKIVSGQQPALSQNNLTLPVTNIELNDSKSLVLDQNVPNPFAEQTIIMYSLPENVSKAQLLFYNIEGKLINVADLEETPGKGQVNVIANDLSNGTYTYTLIVDGKVIDTKKMVRNK